MMARSLRAAGALGTMLLLAALCAPAVSAADLNDIGYVDQAQLANIPSFIQANRDLEGYKLSLNRQFQKSLHGVRDQGTQARIAQQFQNKLAQRQHDVLGPLFERARVAIASVASSKNLSVIVDKRIVIFGGQDVTQAVIDLLNGPGDPIPPVNTPPPSSVGYVDQQQIDALPKFKSANDDFTKFKADEQQQAQGKMKSAKTDADKQQVVKDYQSAVADKEKSEIQPLVDQTRNAISDVARKRGLLLVIDRSNLIFGGTDITSDVTSELK